MVSVEKSSGQWAVGFMNEVVVGGGKMMSGGEWGGGKTKENDVTTKRTHVVSVQNVPGGTVYDL